MPLDGSLRNTDPAFLPPVSYRLDLNRTIRHEGSGFKFNKGFEFRVEAAVACSLHKTRLSQPTWSATAEGRRFLVTSPLISRALKIESTGGQRVGKYHASVSFHRSLKRETI